VARDENVIFLGPPGVGKTHLAVGLAMKAITAGMTVYYASLGGGGGSLATLLTCYG